MQVIQDRKSRLDFPHKTGRTCLPRFRRKVQQTARAPWRPHNWPQTHTAGWNTDARALLFPLATITQLISVPRWNIHEIPCYPSSSQLKHASEGAPQAHLTLPLNNPAVHPRSQTLISQHCWFPHLHSVKLYFKQEKTFRRFFSAFLTPSQWDDIT